MLDICVFAGRFRPFHSGHLDVIREGLRRAQYMFVVVGSCNEPINFRNPFTYEQVREMIRASLDPLDADRVFIFGVEDQDSDLQWVTEVQQVVNNYVRTLSLGRDPEIALIGYAKDGTSYYLQLFPQWKEERVERQNDTDATTLRNDFYMVPDPRRYVEQLRADTGTTIIPRGTYQLLREWVHSEDFDRMKAEFLFNLDYRKQFNPGPYAKEFRHLTADACVIQAGHVLLVRRGEMPGKDLWALPGGHIKDYETFRDAAIRELMEETQIDHAEALLRLCVRGEKLLDDPWRSTRMRTISVAYGILLPGMEQPAVKGSDDAKEARWWAINEVTRSMVFEDHYNVIQDFAGRFRNIVL